MKRRCPVDGSALSEIGSHGIVDYENRWDAEATKWKCPKGHTVFITESESVVDEVPIDHIATRECIGEARRVYWAALKELNDSQQRFDEGKEVSNENRRQWGKMSLEFFAALTGGTSDSWSDNIENLVADLMHFCKKQKIDFYGLLENAQAHFADEEAEEALNRHTPEEEIG